MSVGPRAEKVIIVRNYHERTQKFDFSVFDWKFPFWSNLVKKNQNCQFYGEIWCEYVEFNGGIHFSCFRPETTFLGKLGPKNQNCQFKLKFGN